MPAGADVGSSLEERLLSTGLEMLADTPGERLSMRAVALRLGVSHQAPYVYFGNKRRFLAAVAGTGILEAAGQASTALTTAGGDPEAELHALGDAYLDFIRRRPHVHDLAYGPLVAKSDHPLLQRGATAYWTLLHDTVAACQPPGTSESETLRRCATAWATVYGIARLAAMNQIPTAVPAETQHLIHEAIRTLHQGWHTVAASDSRINTSPRPTDEER